MVDRQKARMKPESEPMLSLLQGFTMVIVDDELLPDEREVG
jgi:hypothetical protein